MHIRNTFFFLILFLATAAKLHAQQAPIFTHHSNTAAYVNPGFAGMSEGILLNGIIRQQWAGFKDSEGNKVAPETYLVTGDMPIKFLRGGVSAAIVQDQLGFENNIGVQLGYSYHLELGGSTLGLGGAFNFVNRTVDFSKHDPIEPNDPILPKSEEGAMLVDFNLGVYWSVPEQYYVGFSVTSLLKSKSKNLVDASTSSSSFVGDRTFYLVAGYQFSIPTLPTLEFFPSLSIMSNIASTQYNLTAKVQHNKKVWGGVNYRYQESIGLMVGFNIKDIHIGYAYDINTLGLGIPGSHEIFVSYCFKLDLDKTSRIYSNPRYL